MRGNLGTGSAVPDYAIARNALWLHPGYEA